MIRLTAVLCCIFVLVSLLRYGSSQPNTSTVSISPSASVTPSNQRNTAVVTTTPNPGVSPSSSSDSPHISYNTTASHSLTAPTTSSNVTPASPSPTQTPAEKKFEATIKVNGTYLPGYSNLTSNDSVTFIRDFEPKLDSFLRQRLSNFKGVNVLELSNGSVEVHFEIVVWKPSNATVGNIIQTLREGNETSALGYILIGAISVTAVQPESSSVVVPTSSTGTVTSATTAPATPAAPTSSTKGTEIWDKAIDYVTPLGTFIIVIVAVALLLILLAALIYICCKYRKLKKRTRFPHHMTINDADWIRSNDDLLMWEQNLRASEINKKTDNGITNRPYNEKRT